MRHGRRKGPPEISGEELKTREGPPIGPREVSGTRVGPTREHTGTVWRPEIKEG